jgi:hypothetical protein
VDATGITICFFGVGRGRTIPWSDVRSIDVRHRRNSGSDWYTVSIGRFSGRTRTLAGIGATKQVLDEHLEAKVEQIRQRWEQSKLSV